MDFKKKYYGEMAVREEFEDAVIIRPSNIYGETDRFLYYYTSDLRRNIKTIPLWKKGEMTIKMPVHVRIFTKMYFLYFKIKIQFKIKAKRCCRWCYENCSQQGYQRSYLRFCWVIL